MVTAAGFDVADVRRIEIVDVGRVETSAKSSEATSSREEMCGNAQPESGVGAGCGYLIRELYVALGHIFVGKLSDYSEFCKLA